MNTRAIRSIVVLAIIAFIIAYLQNMKTCECVDATLVKRLEYTEMAIAGLVSFALIGNIVTDGKFHMRNLVSNNRLANAGLMTVIVGSFGYLAYLVYNYSVDATGCKCADQKAKYVLYAQGAFYAVLVGMIALMILVK